MTDWYQRWAESRIGFHQEATNEILKTHWQIDPKTCPHPVLVPLCGKSRDMTWLHQRGHAVVGVELIEKPCHDFFLEQNLPYTVTEHPNHRTFSGTDAAAGIRILQGDFFALEPRAIGPLSAWYDRAAIVALAPEQREAYARHLARILPTAASGLMLTFDYPKNIRNEVPWPVGAEDVAAAFGPWFSQETLEVLDISADNRWSLPWVHESVLLLTRKDGIKADGQSH